MPVNIAIVGAGRIANVHAGAIRANPDAELVAVADALPEAAVAFAAKWGCEARDVAAIAADPAIAAVLICTPTDTHADLIESFGRAGKHVFCEKPVDLDIARAKAVVAAGGERRQADARLQPPLRPALPRGARGDRRRADRRR
jgi:myo-inositol 2-dehydrogenase/D-chiro-inositol 1-dehydrogenase